MLWQRPHQCNKPFMTQSEKKLSYPSDWCPQRELQRRHEQHAIEYGRLENVIMQRPGHPQWRQHCQHKRSRSADLPQHGCCNACGSTFDCQRVRRYGPGSMEHQQMMHSYPKQRAQQPARSCAPLHAEPATPTASWSPPQRTPDTWRKPDITTIHAPIVIDIGHLPSISTSLKYCRLRRRFNGAVGEKPFNAHTPPSLHSLPSSLVPLLVRLEEELYGVHQSEQGCDGRQRPA